jgi:alkylhydroperoxidase family enzyme
MPRIEIPKVADTDLPEEIRDQAGALVNVFRVMLRSPPIATLVIELGSAQFGSGSLPGPDRELAILTAGSCFGSAYEASQHEQISDAVASPQHNPPRSPFTNGIHRISALLSRRWSRSWRR